MLYWIGTNGKTISDYTNPSITGLISITCSDNNCTSQQLSDMISHTISNENIGEINQTNKYHYTRIICFDGHFINRT